MADGGGTATIQRVRDALDRMYPERQFYYRSQGVVRFITLGKHAQIGATGAALAVLGWLSFATIQVVLRNEIIESKNDRIREVTAAYDQLAQRSMESEKRFLAITGQVEAQHRQLVALIDYRSRLERDVQELHGALSRAVGDRDQARADVDLLRRRITAVEQEMAAATVNAAGLARTLDEARFQADALTQARAATTTENRTLATQLAQLTVALRGAVTEGDIARTALADTQNRLTKTARERDAAVVRGAELDRQVADLNARNAATTGRTTELLREMGRAEDQTAKIATERDEAQRSRDFMTRLVDELQFRLAGLKDSQIDLVERLRVRADENVAMAETIIRQTGLNLEQLLTNAPGAERPFAAGGSNGTAMGGPYVPLAFAGRPHDVQDAFFQAVMGVEMQLDRWNAMEQLLAALPLTPPADSYNLSSGFGNRIDPFTRKPAFHEGMDFAGPLNTPIKAPAPGVVTRVGYWGSYGLMVEIDHGFGITTRYGHLSKAPVKKGQRVAFRQDIGTMGRSGRTTGPHLHYEVLFDGEPMDPANFLKAGRNVFKAGD
jgi:murein DD-endopeptidase MepM/ murein hydrolase activator NlpD